MAIDTPKVIQTQPKSAAAKAVSLGTWLDLQSQPLGTGRGENFAVPANYAIPPARIYVVNHSRTRERKEIKVAVSVRRGAEDALIYDKELAKIYNVDTLTRRIEQGQDMNRYEKVIHPVIFTFKVGSPTGQGKPMVYAIPPARDENSPPPRVEVVEGAWDLFLGNYARMRGYDKFADMGVKEPDPTIMNDERTRHAIRWQGRHNPLLRFTDDGETVDVQGPDTEFAYLEFIRETQKPVTEIIDKEFLSALDIQEN